MFRNAILLKYVQSLFDYKNIIIDERVFILDDNNQKGVQSVKLM